MKTLMSYDKRQLTLSPLSCIMEKCEKITTKYCAMHSPYRCHFLTMLRAQYAIEVRSGNQEMKFKMSLFSQVLQRRLVLRCCLLASYVPLPDAGSANVPALNRLILNFINNTIEPYFAYLLARSHFL